MSVFTNNLKKLIEQNRTTYAALSRELGISKNGLKYWETAGNLPNAEILFKIAKHFGVTVDYLTGIVAPTDMMITDEENELLEVFRQLSKSGRRQLVGKAYELLDGQGVPKSGNKTTSSDVSLVAPILERRIKK